MDEPPAVHSAGLSIALHPSYQSAEFWSLIQTRRVQVSSSMGRTPSCEVGHI